VNAERFFVLREQKQTAGAHAWSLRRRLMFIVAVGTVAAWLVGGVVVMRAALAENERLQIAKIEDFARVLMRFAEHEIEEIQADRPGDIIHVETAVTLDRRFRYQVWDQSGKLVLISADTEHEPFASLAVDGHQEIEIDGIEHYVYTLWNNDRTLQIQVIERADPLDFVFATVGRELAVGFIITILALLAIKVWLLGRATSALDQAAKQLVNRSPADLEPIVADNPPSELIPLLKAINCLFGRVGHALEAERNFSATAAHELRTPLAAVRVQAQVADRARTAGGTHEALQQLGVCVERAGRMIDQMLTLARFESVPIAPGSLVLVHLDKIVAQVLSELRPMIAERKINLEVRGEPAIFCGLEFGLASLVRNLVENAVRYTPDSGVVRIETWQESRATYVAVEDSGPGIAPDERERVFEPFYRIPMDGVEGCGIGLSIVRSVVRLHSGQISLSESALGGLRVVVQFHSVDETIAPVVVG
jgi:signal transduction histidine kinase